MKTSRKTFKELIKNSADIEVADRLITESYGFTTYREKVAFLLGMFDIQTLKLPKDDSAELSYWLMLRTIILKIQN